MASKVTLIIIGILVLAIGVLGAFPALAAVIPVTLGTEPLWYAIVKIALGLIAIIVGIATKR
ncbi:MAG: hypothetical protein A2Z35_04525 [Actinobacteria bacterium RBG_19FT_COMBO_36_27]|jgi:predicted transglutaminase-like protease|nr:MAG: hypothetical protein A2Z35_04525 [Actinobacteria bacterium RBG_19FT_COMBO_36_27]